MADGKGAGNAPNSPSNQAANQTKSSTKSPSSPEASLKIKPKGTKEHTKESQTGTPEDITVEDLHVKIHSLATRLSSIETVCAGYKESLEFTQAQVLDLKEENNDLRHYIDSIELEVNRNMYAINKLESKQDRLEMSTKKKNLIFEGVQEQAKGRENLHDVLRDLFVEMGIKDKIAYDSLYRLGQRRRQSPRPILVSFMRQDSRDFVFSRRASLKDSDIFHRVWVTDDVTPPMKRVKTVVREVAKVARNLGAKCTSTPYTVTIDDKRYNEANLQDLPPQYSVENVKVKKIGDSLCYHSEHAPFSNLFPILVTVGNHDYMSSEQAYFHIMAMHHQLRALAAKILWSRDPYEIMHLGNEIETDEEWNRKAEDVMFTCMYQKFRHNNKLREKLLSTGDLELVEATYNKKWGAAATLNSTSLKKHEWSGGNLQGKLLMRVRQALREELNERE